MSVAEVAFVLGFLAGSLCGAGLGFLFFEEIARRQEIQWIERRHDAETE